MKIYILVKYTDHEAINPDSGDDVVYTETEIISCFSSRQDAMIELKHSYNAVRLQQDISFVVLESEVC